MIFAGPIGYLEGRDRFLSRPSRQLFGLCRQDGMHQQAENKAAKSVAQGQYKLQVYDRADSVLLSLLKKD